jgi:molybdate transport system substrate-binding protein
MRRSLLPLPAVVALAAAALAGCAGHDASGSGDGATLRISAAASLKQAFSSYGEAFTAARARFSFAGSDQLAAQIRAGGRPDVFAAANSTLPDALHAEGLVEKPVAFARNRLVLAVPAEHAKVQGLEDLTRAGVTLAVGAPAVPVGAYTRKVLGGLPAAESKAILGHVRSNEPDVAGVVGKVAQGAVDAGFMYITDVEAAGGRLRAIELPARLQPEVVYEIAVVKASKHPSEARAFVRGLLTGAGAGALDRAGFERP